MAAQPTASIPAVVTAGTTASAADNLWTAAVAQLSEDDQTQIQVQQKDKLVVLNETLSIAQQKAGQCAEKEWKYTRSDGTKVVFRDLFNKIVSWIDKFKAVGDLAASFDPVHAAPAWAVVKILLQVAISDSQIYSAMLEGLETVTNLIAQYAVFEEVYLKHTSQAKALLKQSITKLYTRILTYLIKTKKYFEQNTAVRIAKGMGRQSGFVSDDIQKIRAQQNITEELARLIDAEDIRVVAHTAQTTSSDVANISAQLRTLLADVRQPITAIRSDLTAISQRYDKEQRLKILQWISTMPYPQHHDLIAKHRLKDSGLWFLNHPSYLDWRQSSTSCILWLHGIPGSGKSNLMSLVVDSLRENRLNKRTEPMAYAYCLRSPSELHRAEPEAIARSLLRQLTYSASTAAINNVVMQKYETLTEDGFEPRDLNLDDCEELIFGVLQHQPATIVIDAMDECVPERRYQLLGLLERLTSSAACPLKVLVSSRDHGDVASRMTKQKAMTIDTKENLGDIDLYIQAEVDRSIQQKSLLGGDVSENLRSIVLRRLKDGAQGMFLWVSLMIKTLCNPDRIKFESDALEELEKLPQGLNDLYVKMCERIRNAGSKARQLAETSLRWLICSQSPLKSTEFVALVSFNAANSGMSTSVSVVLDVCGNLVIHDTDLDVFRLAHLSIREFLETQSEFTSNIAHATAAGVCLSTLTSTDWLNKDVTWSTSPLYRYSTLFGMTHLSMCKQQQRTTTLAPQIKQFFPPSGALTPHSQKWVMGITDAVKTLSWDSPLKERFKQIAGNTAQEPKTWIFAACVFGLDELVEEVCRLVPAIPKSLNVHNSTTVHLTSQYGYLEITKMLTNVGVDLDARNDKRESALSLASMNGHVQVVQYLLECKARQECDSYRYGSPLQAASFHGYKDIVEMLSTDADLNANKGRFGTALQAASFRGHQDIVLMLLNLGAKVNAPSQAIAATPESVDEAQDYQSSKFEYLSSQLARFGVPKREQGSREIRHEVMIDCLQDGVVDGGIPKGGLGSALQVACRGGHAEVVALLLNYDADVESESGMYGHALQAAAINGSQPIVKSLLSRGANVNAQSGLYGCALQAACRRNHTSLVKLLLASGADVNMHGGHYHTSLQAAARTGNPEIISLLLQHGANVNAAGGQYCTALQAAAVYGFTDIVQQLINHNADMNIRGGQYHSAIEAAAYGGRVDTVRLLFEGGANVYNTLHIAALEGHLEVVRHLVSSGLNVNRSRPVYGTPLLSAISGNHHQIIELLLDHQTDINRGNGFYGYPLQLAAAAGNAGLVRRLIQMGSDPTRIGGLHGVHLTTTKPEKWDVSKQKPGDWQESALESAAAAGKVNTVGVILQEMLEIARMSHPWQPIQEEMLGIIWSIISMSLLKAAWYDHSEVISTLLGACENETRLHRASALWWACKKGDEPLVRNLLDRHKPSINDQYFSQYGSNNNREMRHTILDADPLTIAIRNGHPNLVKLLLSPHPDRTVFGKNHRALQAACIAGDQSLVRFFIDNGADIERVGDRTSRPLMLASASGNAEIVRMLLSAGASPNFWSYDDEVFEVDYLTALHAACAEGHDEVAAVLISHGAIVDVQTSSCPTALFLACEAGHLNVVKLLLQHGANLNVTVAASENLSTALHVATSKGFHEIAKVLLDNNADSNAHGGKFGTALKTAAFLGHINILSALVSAGANVNFKEDVRQRDVESESVTDYQESETSSHSNYESALEELSDDFDVHLDPEQRALTGNRSSIRSSSLSQTDRSETDITNHAGSWSASMSVVLYISKLKMSVTVRQVLTMAMIEIQVGHTTPHVPVPASTWRSDGYFHRSEYGFDTRDLMMDTYSDDSRLVPTGRGTVRPGRFGSAMHAAAHSGSAACVQALIDQGAEISPQDRYRQTPLHHAAYEGHFEAVRLLLDRGALINVRDKQGRTALALAAASGHTDILELLLSRGATVDESDNEHWTPLHLAARNNHMSVAKSLLSHGASMGAQDDRGQTPLIHAVWQDNVQIVQYLTRNGADIDSPVTLVSRIRTSWNRGGTIVENSWETKTELPVLHIAAGSQSHKVVQMLIQRGHDVNARAPPEENAKEGKTPLHHALRRCDDAHFDVVQVLLSHGADPNLKNPKGKSPLSFALKHGSCAVADLLIRAGGNVKGCSKGSTMIHQALRSTWRTGSCKMLKLVLEHGADVNAPNEQGQTVLQALIEHRQSDGRSPSEWKSPKREACALLLAHGARVPSGSWKFHLQNMQDKIRDGEYDKAFLEASGFELHSPLYNLYKPPDKAELFL